MTITAIREKLHHQIDAADDKQVEAIYSVVTNELSAKKIHSQDYDQKIKILEQACIDRLFLADLKEIQNDFAHLDNEDL